MTGLSFGINECPAVFACHGYFQDYGTLAYEAG